MTVRNPKFALLILFLMLGMSGWQVQAQADTSALAPADTALLDGDYATAIAQYTSASGDATLKCPALYGLGVSQYRALDYTDAETAFTNQLSGGCDPTFETLVMRGQAREKLGNGDGALADYQQALTLKPGLLDSYLYERIAALAPDQSVYFLRLATEAQRQPEGKFALREQLAHVYLLVGSTQSALNEYNTLLQEIDAYLATLAKVDGAEFDTNGSTRARIELAAAEIEIANGHSDSGYARLQKVITSYPDSASALPALVELVQDGQTVDLVTRMTINVSNQNYNPVVSVLPDYLKQNAKGAPAELYLLLGQAQRGLGDSDSAQATFAQLRQLFPTDPLASTAAFEQANTYLQTSDYDKAVTAFEQVAKTYPQSPEAPKALLLAATTERDHGTSANAIALYDQLGKSYPNSDQAKTGLFAAGIQIRSSDPTTAANFFSRVGSAEGYVWQGKVLQQAGNTAAAQQAWQKAEATEPDSFFGIRACELLGNLPSLSNVPMTVTTNPPPDPSSAQWVAQTFNLKTASADLSPDLANDTILQRGVELWKLGMWDDAHGELDVLHKLHRDDPAGLLQLAIYYQSIPIYRSSVLAATRLIYASGQSLLAIPNSVLQLAFPLDYADLIIPLSQKYALDPLLVASLIHQESSFDPTVGSIADARGLMQFVPSTAQDVATRISWPNYTLSDLYRPIVSVNFGTYYLKFLRDYSGSDAGAILSYNAGPGAAASWISEAGGDIETLYEVIGYAETQSYLDLIYTNHFIYQHLYTANPPACKPA